MTLGVGMRAFAAPVKWMLANTTWMTREGMLRGMTYFCAYTHRVIIHCHWSPLWHSVQLAVKEIFPYHCIVLEAVFSPVTALEKYMAP